MASLSLGLLLAASLLVPQKFREFLATEDPRVPAKLAQAGCSARGADGSQWTCTPPGVTRRLTNGTTEYLAGKRYLPDDDVKAILVESPASVWMKTATGVSHIEYRPMT